MKQRESADNAFEYLNGKFGPDFASKNPNHALRFAGDWMIADGLEEVGQSVLSLQDVLFRPAPALQVGDD